MFFKKRKVCKFVLTSDALCAIIHHADTETCRCGVIGRRSGLKIRRSKIRTGSSPVSGNNIAEWSSPVARWAHNPKVAGSNPASAINKMRTHCVRILFIGGRYNCDRGYRRASEPSAAGGGNSEARMCAAVEKSSEGSERGFFGHRKRTQVQILPPQLKKQLVLVQNRLFFALFEAKVEEKGNFIPLEYPHFSLQ